VSDEEKNRIFHTELYLFCDIILFFIAAFGLDVRICRRLGGIFAHPLLASFIYSERWAFSLFVSFERVDYFYSITKTKAKVIYWLNA
jgi:hypothetical protein